MFIANVLVISMWPWASVVLAPAANLCGRELNPGLPVTGGNIKHDKATESDALHFKYTHIVTHTHAKLCNAGSPGVY